MKIVVLDGHCLNPGDLSWSRLEALGEVHVYERTHEKQIVERALGAAAVLTNKVPLSAATMAALADLRYIGVLATGYNIVDVEAASNRGIVVTNVPTYGTQSVAQLTIALLLELCHHVGLHSQAVKVGEWASNPDWSMARTPLVELAGKRFGCIGYGRIGQQTARIASAMGMEVMVHSRSEGTSLEEVFTQSDVVSLHCPLTPDTERMVNASRLERMKDTAFLLNTSRGGLIAEADLAAALNHGAIAGAGLDVLTLEPPAADSPLFSAKNCIVTPHIAWATREARERLLTMAVHNLAAFQLGKPVNVVA